MLMGDLRERLLRGVGVFALAALIGSFSPAAYAQDADEIEEAVEEEEEEDRVVVTGSRLGRSTFTSTKPVQVISGELSRDLGLVDTGAILRDSSAATGQQIDQTFNSFVLDNGPGAETISLRNLGANRTLLLLNGRRLAPSGVEGAPVAPDLTLIPSLLTERIELLLDGASSVYGSDAIAGAVNIILRRDFDGLEVEGFRTITDEDGGEETNIAASWGFNSDRGFIGFGVEYNRINRIKVGDRSYTNGGCRRDVEVTPDGQIRTITKTDAFDFGHRTTDCRRAGEGLFSRFFTTAVPYGVAYPVAGAGNTGIPGFSETNQFGFAVDADGDGQPDVEFNDFSTNVNRVDADRQDLLAEGQQLLAMTYGEYNIGTANNITTFFEALYSSRRTRIRNGTGGFSVDLPASNPFNPCNPNGIRGVDCGLAYDSLLTNPNFAQQVADNFGLTPAEFRDLGIVDLFQGEIGPAQATNFSIRIPGDRDNADVDIDQFRLVGGLRGELPQLEFGPISDLRWEVYAAYTRSSGSSIRRGVLEDRVVLSAQTTIEDPNNPGQFICGLDLNGDGIPDPDGSTQENNNNAPNCVPVDFFAPSLFTANGYGSFATAEERDFLFGRRTFRTTYEQTVFNAFLESDLFELQGGRMQAGFGVEYRKDEINSEPDDAAEDGLLIGFFSDGGAAGSKELFEVFGETRLPLLADLPFIKSFEVNASFRWTEEEFYGSAWTYSVDGGYRPIDWLLLRGSYGTSFRAPNLRENFLRGQSGFLSFNDPCVVPADAFDLLNNVYLPQLDNRDPIILDNCRLAGVDPTTLGTGNTGQPPNAATSVELPSGGSLDLEPETSTSWSAGFSFEQPWTDWFSLNLSVTYYDIEIENTIAEPNPQFIINDCYELQPNLSSAFCSRITRGSDQRLSVIDLSFININQLNARGVDFDLVISKELQLFERVLEVTIDLEAAYSAEQQVITVGDDGTVNIDDNVGEFAVPEWNGRASLFLDYSDFRFTWNTRFLGAVSQDRQFVDAFDDTSGNGDTCFPGECVARDVGFADEYFRHDVSLRYNMDTWTFRVGVNNVFNEAPPLVDGDEIQTNPDTNVPLGAGYDLIGRRYFVNVQKRF